MTVLETRQKDTYSDLYILVVNADFNEVLDYLAERMRGIKYLGMECCSKEVSKICFEGKNFYYDDCRCLLMEL